MQAHFTDRGNEPEILFAKPDVRAESGPYSTGRTCAATGQLSAAGPLQAQLTALAPGAWALESNRHRIKFWLCHGFTAWLQAGSQPLCAPGPPLLSEDEMVSAFVANVQVQDSGAWKTELPLAHCNLIPTFSRGQEPSRALSRLLLKQPSHISPQFTTLTAELALNPGCLPSSEHSQAQRRPDFHCILLPRLFQNTWGRGLHTALVATRECLTGAIFPLPEFLSSPAALVCLGCLPVHPLASSHVQNNRMLIESKKEQLRVEDQAAAPWRHVRCEAGTGSAHSPGLPASLPHRPRQRLRNTQLGNHDALRSVLRAEIQRDPLQAEKMGEEKTMMHHP